MKRAVKETALAILFVLLCLPFALAAENEFQEANQEYARGQYQKALLLYNTVLHKEGISAPLLFNMGNAFYQSGDLGHAVLYYERALVLDPGNPDVEANLNYVRRESGLSLGPQPWWVRWTALLSINSWTRLMIISLALLGVLLLVRGLGRLQSPLTPVSSTAGGKVLWSSLIVVFLISAAAVLLQKRQLDRYIVVENDAAIHISPFDGAESRGVLKSGTLFSASKSFNDFFFGTDQAGLSGWVLRKGLEPIVPGTGDR